MAVYNNNYPEQFMGLPVGFTLFSLMLMILSKNADLHPCFCNMIPMEYYIYVIRRQFANQEEIQ